MLTSEEQMEIIKGAITNSYKGPVFKLIDQASIEKGQTASTDEQKEQGLRGSDGNTSMAFNDSKDDFNTKGMNFDLDIRKYDKEGNLVKSYQKVPPGIKSLNMGEEEGTVVETPSQYKHGGVRKYQDAGFIGPELPPGYEAPTPKEEEPIVNNVIEEPVTITTREQRNNTSSSTPTRTSSRAKNTSGVKGKKNITELQNLLVSEGFDVGDAGADGLWGNDTQAAFDKYTSRTDSEEVSWTDRIRGGMSKILSGNRTNASQSIESFTQYFGNALLQGYGLVSPDESYFDVTEDDLRTDEVGAYKSILRDNLNKGKKGNVNYSDYSNKDDIVNAGSSEESRVRLRSRGIVNTLVGDINPFGNTNSTKEALNTLTGNARYTLDDEGEVHVQDNYDFNYSQREVKKTGTTFSGLWDAYTSTPKEWSAYQRAHTLGDKIKSTIPVDINLGSATDLGLSPQEMKSLQTYNSAASGVKTISTMELIKRGTKKLFGYEPYQEGGFNREQPKPMIQSSVFKYPSKREELKREINNIVSLEKKSVRPQTKKLLEVSNFMENSMGDNDEAYGRTYTNSQASIDEIMLNDLFDKKKDEKGNVVNHSATQLRYFDKLKRAGLPTNKNDFKKELNNDNPKAAVNAMRMVYGKVPKAIPEVTDTLGMFNYYNDHYRKNNKITDLTKSKERFYEGYKMEFKHGGKRSKYKP